MIRKKRVVLATKNRFLSQKRCPAETGQVNKKIKAMKRLFYLLLVVFALISCEETEVRPDYDVSYLTKINYVDRTVSEFENEISSFPLKFYYRTYATDGAFRQITYIDEETNISVKFKLQSDRINAVKAIIPYEILTYEELVNMLDDNFDRYQWSYKWVQIIDGNETEYIWRINFDEENNSTTLEIY